MQTKPQAFLAESSPSEYKNSATSFFENQAPKEWLSTIDAANYLCVTPNALRICVHRGQVRAYRFGRRLRFRVEELRQVLLGKRA